MSPFYNEIGSPPSISEPAGITLFSEHFRRGIVRLTLCRDISLSFIPESELLIEFTRHDTIVHILGLLVIESIDRVEVNVNNQIIICDVISNRTPIEHPVVEGILGMTAIEQLGV